MCFSVFGCSAEKSFTNVGHVNCCGLFSTQTELWIIVTFQHTLCLRGSFSVLVGKIWILLSGWLTSKRQRPITVVCHVGRWEQLSKDGEVIKMTENNSTSTWWEIDRSTGLWNARFWFPVQNLSLYVCACTCIHLIHMPAVYPWHHYLYICQLWDEWIAVTTERLVCRADC